MKYRDIFSIILLIWYYCMDQDIKNFLNFGKIIVKNYWIEFKAFIAIDYKISKHNMP